MSLDITTLDQLFCTLWKTYHLYLKCSLPTTSNSWAYTPAEWKQALLTTRPMIFKYASSMEIPHTLLNTTVWTDYFTNRSVNRGDYAHGITPLMLAVILNQPAIVQSLLDLGAEPDLQTEEGESARMFAEHGKNAEILCILDKFPPPELLTNWDFTN